MNIRYYFSEDDIGISIIIDGKENLIISRNEITESGSDGIENVIKMIQLSHNSDIEANAVIEFVYREKSAINRKFIVFKDEFNKIVANEVDYFSDEFNPNDVIKTSIDTGLEPQSGIDFSKSDEYYLKKARRTVGVGKLKVTRRQAIAGAATIGIFALASGGSILVNRRDTKPEAVSSKIIEEAPETSRGNNTGDAIYTTASENIRSGKSSSFASDFPDNEWTYTLKGSEPQIAYTTNAFSYKSGFDVILVSYDDGKEILTYPIKDRVPFIIDTIVDDKKSVAWRDGSLFNYWNKQDGLKSIEIPASATLLNTGSSSLFIVEEQDKKETVYTIKDGKLFQNSIPDNLLALSADSDGVISAHKSGIIGFTNSVSTSNIQLSMDGDLNLLKFISAGRGLVFTAWSKNKTPGQDEQVIYAIHKASSGELLSQFVDSFVASIPTEANGKVVKMAPGGHLAIIANRIVIRIATGEILLDARTISGSLVEARGQFIAGKDAAGSFLYRFDEQIAYRDSVPMLNNPNNNMVLINSESSTVTMKTNRANHNQA